MDVHFYVTRACNLTCRHCYYDASGMAVDRSDELSVAEIQKTIALLCDKHQATIEMEGGEIFLRRDVSELLSALSAEQLNAITITTNGTVPLEDVADGLRKLHALRISIEGHTGDIHGRLRQSDLEDIVCRGQQLLRAGVPVVCRCTLSQANWMWLEDMIATFGEWGFNSIQLFEFQSVGRGREIAREFALGADAIKRSIEVLVRLAHDNGCPHIRLSLPASRLPIVHEVLGGIQSEGRVVAKRVALTNSLTIDRNGDLSVCPWCVGADVKGNLRRTDLHNFLEGAKAAGVLIHQCAHCSAVHLHVSSHSCGNSASITPP